MPRRNSTGARVTIDDVAAHCGVSKAAVSKALSRRPGACDLAAATRERIAAAAAALGYVPGRSTARRHQRIALLFGARTPKYSGLYDGFVDALAETLAGAGYDLLFVPVPGGIRDWERLSGDLGFDGLVVADPAPPHLERILAAARLPAVLVNQHLALPALRVRPDDAGGARLLVEHLAAAGIRRIIYAQTVHRSGHPSLRDRQEGYRAAMAARGLTAEVVEGPMDILAQRLAGLAGPSGVVAYNAPDGSWLKQELDRRGIAVPGRVALACFDDVELTQKLGITCIRIPGERMGRESARRLLAVIEGGAADPAQDVVVPVSLLRRGSTPA